MGRRPPRSADLAIAEAGPSRLSHAPLRICPVDHCAAPARHGGHEHTTGNHLAGVRFRSRSPRRMSELAAQGRTVFGPDSRRCTGVNAGAACANRHPQLRGRSGPCAGAGTPLQRCAWRALQQNAAVAAPPDPSHLSLPAPRWQNWRLKPLAFLEQLPRHQRQSRLESPARRCEFGGEHWPGGPDPATVSCKL